MARAARIRGQSPRGRVVCCAAANQEVPVHTSRFSQLAIAVAGASVLLFASMPLVTKMGAMPSRVSFPLFMLGGLLGLVGLLLGLVALFTTRAGTGRSGRGLAWG